MVGPGVYGVGDKSMIIVERCLSSMCVVCSIAERTVGEWCFVGGGMKMSELAGRHVPK